MKRLIGGLLAVAVLFLVTAPVADSGKAFAEDNGVGRTPAMGWSSWSFYGHDPTLHAVEAQAEAMVRDGLKKAGYTYVLVDDYWYVCPGSQGPDVGKYGHWVVSTSRFPDQGRLNGIEALVRYVHHLGLKFGLYVTPGISKQAVAENTRIKGTSYTADEIATKNPEAGYNCGGMVGIDYAKPGAQAFVNSWADEFASWGVDYLKIDGVGTGDIPDVKAWSRALRQTGRPIYLALSNRLSIKDAATWKRLSDSWRTGPDIDCYCGPASADSGAAFAYPLTIWYWVATRFDQVAQWAPYGGPGGYNDYDSLEIGNGIHDGLNPAQRQAYMSLWALGSAPLILGADLTHLNKLDRTDLINRSVISVDQDGIDAVRVADGSSSQVFAKTEHDGDVVVGLFNTSAAPEVVSTTAKALGLSTKGTYELDNLWTHHSVTSSGSTIAAEVPPYGVVLYGVRKR
ncbi:MAG TPA: glycoside hydrolase family 27 protein [Acidimicrobiales bacterium]|nr:glycoside hydrolase family 27 protein [Acidimicrobiales bacterium]